MAIVLVTGSYRDPYTIIEENSRHLCLSCTCHRLEHFRHSNGPIVQSNLFIIVTSPVHVTWYHSLATVTWCGHDSCTSTPVYHVICPHDDAAVFVFHCYAHWFSDIVHKFWYGPCDQKEISWSFTLKLLHPRDVAFVVVDSIDSIVPLLGSIFFFSFSHERKRKPWNLIRWP